MATAFVLGGAKAWQSYDKHIRNCNDKKGLRLKTFEKNDKSYAYWYRQVERSPEEQEIARQKGIRNYRVKDLSLGKHLPEDVVQNQLEPYKDKVRFISEGNAIVLDLDLFHVLEEYLKPHYKNLEILIVEDLLQNVN